MTYSKLGSMLITGLLVANAAQAEVTAEEAAKLGKELTAIGAVQAANADGSIPEWTGGVNFTDEQRSLTPQQIEDMDPEKLAAIFSAGRKDEKPLFTITAENMAQYAELLSEGHKTLLKRYPSYKLPVYPSLRSGYFPEKIEQATIANATRAKLVGTEDVVDAKLGFPFPIPKRPEEIIWNHRMKFRGAAVRRYNNQAIVQLDGSYTITKLVEDVEFRYANIDNPPAADDATMLYYLSEYLAPPRIVGQFILAREPIQGAREAWVYNPSIRRVRRLPDAGFDNPTEGSDGQQTYDQIDMFNGSLQRYTWKLVGKKEMIIPYNSWSIADRRLKFDDILKPKHINQDVTHYERHRVWVVEATLRPDISHQFKTRRFYVDEDSWSIAMVDIYDNRDQFWKFQEGHLGTFPMIPTVTAVPEVIYDLQTGRYFVTAMQNEDKPSDYQIEFDDNYFTSQSLKRKARR
ncbi:MAG: DUF1329 domain-containing protein [Nevskiales bacterium]